MESRDKSRGWPARSLIPLRKRRLCHARQLSCTRSSLFDRRLYDEGTFYERRTSPASLTLTLKSVGRFYRIASLHLCSRPICSRFQA